MRRRSRQRKRMPAPAPKASPQSLAKPLAPKRSRSLLGFGGLALALVLCAGFVDAAPAQKLIARIEQKVHAPIVQEVPRPAPPPPKPAWGASLPAIAVTNNNTNARGELRLYTERGALDMSAVYAFMRLACTVPDAPDRESGEVAEPLDPRLVQLAFRAAYHFNGAAMSIVSATRRGAHGKHGHGEALDFKLEGVSAADLAKYVRTYPRAGIGIYTHPKTQYVHVDVRERSYHWVDASPPGVTWRERLLPDPKHEARDDGYAATSDLPETAN